MGKVKTAAAKKYHEKKDNGNSSSSDDENLHDLKRSSRSQKSSTANKKQSSPRQASGRPSRSTRSSAPIEKTNGKNGASINTSSDSSSEDEEPIANRKRKSSVEKTTPKKAKPSTSASSSKNKPTEHKPKSSKKKKKTEEERYEVEEILGHKFEGTTKYFLIRWKGYDSSVDSWESQYNISCPGLLAKYYEKNPDASVSLKRGKKNKKKNVVPQPRPLKIDEQLDYDSEWDENEDYEVERILDVCIHRNNKREFLIRWKGYSSKSDSWEPEEHLDCADLIAKFMEKVDQMKNVSEKELRPVRSQTQRFTLMTQESARRLSKRNAGRQRAVYHDCDE